MSSGIRSTSALGWITGRDAKVCIVFPETLEPFLAL
jgi:hypothetical protein